MQAGLGEVVLAVEEVAAGDPVDGGVGLGGKFLGDGGELLAAGVAIAGFHLDDGFLEPGGAGEGAGAVGGGDAFEGLLGFGVVAGLGEGHAQAEDDGGFSGFGGVGFELAVMGDGFVEFALGGEGLADLELGIVEEGGVGEFGGDLFERGGGGGIIAEAALVEGHDVEGGGFEGGLGMGFEKIVDGGEGIGEAVEAVEGLGAVDGGGFDLRAFGVIP